MNDQIEVTKLTEGYEIVYRPNGDYDSRKRFGVTNIEDLLELIKSICDGDYASTIPL